MHLDTALEALAHLAHVFLEALKRFQADRAIRRRVNNHAAANDSHLRRTLDGALRDVTAGDRTDPADLERLADHGPTQMDNLLTRLELAFQGSADVVRQLINDVVLAHLDTAFLGERKGAIVGHYVEADDDGVLR